MVTLIIQQQFASGSALQDVTAAKADAAKQKTTSLQARVSSVVAKQSPAVQRAVALASEKGSSAWLSALPTAAHGFDLTKAAFRDALCLRYGWLLPKVPSTCVCGSPFSASHALQCPTGGFPSVRHNEIRDMLSDLLKEVCHDVSLEPSLQPLTGERLSYRSACTDDEARLDVAASGFFGGRFERTFLDIRVFNAFATSNQGRLSSVYRRHEQEKRRKYGQRVQEVEHASFVPIVF